MAIKLSSANKPANGQPQSAQSWQARALPFANKMNADAELSQDFSAVSEAQEVTRRSGHIILADLRRIFGKELDSMPVPDSEGGNNPDLYPLEGSKKRKGSFFNDLFAQYSWGAEIEKTLEQIKLAEDPKTANQAEQRFQDMSATELADNKKKFQNKRNYGRTTLKNAVALHFQIKALMALPGLKVIEKLDDSGNPAETTTPFIVRNSDIENKPDEFKLYSVDALLGIDVAKVHAEGGNWEALKKAQRRGTQANGQQQLPALKMETAAPFAERLGQYMQKVGANEQLEANFLQFLSDEQGDDTLIWLGRLHTELTAMFKRKELAVRYAKLEAELEAAPEEQEAEKEAATA